jgi:hypothetical protein
MGATPTLAQTDVQESKKYDLIITPRFNSAGHFPFTGALLNKNLNFDFNIYYERNKYGFFIFQSFDLEDRHSYVNYLQPGVFRKFNVSPTVQFGLYFGYIFSQTTGFRDGDSDYYTALTTSWDITEKIRLENTALFFDLTIQSKMANRLLLKYTLKNFRFDAYMWNRIILEDGNHSVSGSLAVNFPLIHLSDRVGIQTTASYQGYITENKPVWARRSGLLFSVAFPITLNP